MTVYFSCLGTDVTEKWSKWMEADFFRNWAGVGCLFLTVNNKKQKWSSYSKDSENQTCFSSSKSYFWDSFWSSWSVTGNNYKVKSLKSFPQTTCVRFYFIFKSCFYLSQTDSWFFFFWFQTRNQTNKTFLNILSCWIF